MTELSTSVKESVRSTFGLVHGGDGFLRIGEGSREVLDRRQVGGRREGGTRDGGVWEVGVTGTSQGTSVVEGRVKPQRVS